MALTGKRLRFYEEYLVDNNAVASAIRAGYKQNNAKNHAARLMRDPEILGAIEEARRERSARVQITQDMVLERWWQIATANVNDVVQFRRLACRYCHGIDHLYQWKDEVEFEEASDRARNNKKSLPQSSGGFGYALNAPNPSCPRCMGEGIGHAHIKDTRNLEGAAALIYAGVKESRDGVEVKLMDQAKALENVARHLGMFNDKLALEHSGKMDMVVNIGDADADL